MDNHHHPRQIGEIPYLVVVQDILHRWTWYCSELYNHKTNRDPAVLNCLQTTEEDVLPILHEELEAAVKSLKKGGQLELTTYQRNWFIKQGEKPWSPPLQQSATRPGRQENSPRHGPSHLLSRFPRKVTYSCAKIIERSANWAKSCRRSYSTDSNPKWSWSLLNNSIVFKQDGAPLNRSSAFLRETPSTSARPILPCFHVLIDFKRALWETMSKYIGSNLVWKGSWLMPWKTMKALSVSEAGLSPIFALLMTLMAQQEKTQ